jgi:hypothetical protein
VTAWDDLQAAYAAATSRIALGQDPHEAARQAVWDHCRPVMCWGINGHEGQPRHRLHRYAATVWVCPRCRGQFITRRQYAGNGESVWRWVALEDARA